MVQILTSAYIFTSPTVTIYDTPCCPPVSCHLTCNKISDITSSEYDGYAGGGGGEALCCKKDCGTFPWLVLMVLLICP